MKRIIRYVFVAVMIMCLAFGLTANATTVDSSMLNMQSSSLEKQKINCVEVSYIEPVAGDFPIMATVPIDAKYSIDTAASWWYNCTEANAMRDEQLFFTGGAFELVIRVIPADGYEFDAETKFIVNGETIAPDAISSSELMYISDTYYLRMPIERADILIVKPEVGKPAVMPVTSDEGYSINTDCTYWKNLTTGEVVSAGDVFEDNNAYGLFLALRSDLEFQFTDEIKLFVTVEDKTAHSYDTQQVEINNFTDSALEAAQLVYTFGNPPVGDSNVTDEESDDNQTEQSTEEDKTVDKNNQTDAVTNEEENLQTSNITSDEDKKLNEETISEKAPQTGDAGVISFVFLIIVSIFGLFFGKRACAKE